MQEQKIWKEKALLKMIKNKEVNINTLTVLFYASRKIYMIISVIVMLTLLIAGSFYISTILPPEYEIKNVLLAWLAFLIGNILIYTLASTIASYKVEGKSLTPIK